MYKIKIILLAVRFPKQVYFYFFLNFDDKLIDIFRFSATRRYRLRSPVYITIDPRNPNSIHVFSRSDIYYKF